MLVIGAAGAHTAQIPAIPIPLVRLPPREASAMVHSAAQPNEEYPTQSWLAGRLAEAYHLTADDVDAVTELRGGTAMLVGIGGPTVGSRVLIWRDEVAVGRGDRNPVWLSSGTVSRHHATFVRTPEGYDVVDAGSLNGTYLNNALVSRAALRTGDEIRFGSCRFLYFAATDDQPDRGVSSPAPR